MSFCWSSSLGILMCHLSHRGQVAHLPPGLFCFIFSQVALFQLWSDCPPCWGKGVCGTNGNLWYKDTPCQYQEGMLHSLYRSLYFSGARANLSLRPRLINFSRPRGLEVSTLASSNCGAESIDLSTQSSLVRSEDLLPLLR